MKQHSPLFAAPYAKVYVFTSINGDMGYAFKTAILRDVDVCPYSFSILNPTKAQLVEIIEAMLYVDTPKRISFDSVELPITMTMVFKCRWIKDDENDYKHILYMLNTNHVNVGGTHHAIIDFGPDTDKTVDDMLAVLERNT